MNLVGVIFHRYGLTLAFSLLEIIASFQFSGSNNRSNRYQLQFKPASDQDLIEANTHKSISSRRDFLHRAPVGIVSVGVLTYHNDPAVAKSSSSKEAEDELPSKEYVRECFNIVRYEISDSQGGVAYMQERIDKEDFVGLLEFTRTYDLELRKLRMGKAKKLIQDKDVKARATEYANAVTFDLIGMNRSSRQGQENVDSANKYLQELRDDVTKFLNLEEAVKFSI